MCCGRSKSGRQRDVGSLFFPDSPDYQAFWQFKTSVSPDYPVATSSVKFIPPGLIVAVLLVLTVSQLCFAFLPYRRRAYLPILIMTAVGFGLGQLWDYLGLPSVRLGQANVLPALVFALLLQPLARFIPRPSREPKEPRPSG